jgi:hypothetical protein
MKKLLAIVAVLGLTAMFASEAAKAPAKAETKSAKTEVKADANATKKADAKKAK